MRPMRIIVFLNSLGLGGTEKAACRWARGLTSRGHQVTVLTLQDGPRRRELEAHRVPCSVLDDSGAAVTRALRDVAPEVIHSHAPGHSHPGDILGEALATLPKIPVVQTNIFGRFDNPSEEAWVDFRLFISWTSCVQAGRRAFLRLNENFFRRASVAVYPVDPIAPPGAAQVRAFRDRHGVADQEVLFGRLSRPDPVKWTPLAVDAFRLAAARHPSLKLLLREPPPEVAGQLKSAPNPDQFLILPATAEAAELDLTTASLDVVLHTSLVGESFGYGIAEPMNFAKPVITNSVPTLDQAQIELVREGECGFVTSTAPRMAEAMVRLAADARLRVEMGTAAQRHIRKLADPELSLSRLETALTVAKEGRANPFLSEDVARAATTAAYLDAHQFGHSFGEQLALRPLYYRTRFKQFRQMLRRRWRSKSR